MDSYMLITKFLKTNFPSHSREGEKVVKVLPGLELGSPDSKAEVLTTTP